MFAVMKGNFSALAVKRIREKSKNDPPLYLYQAKYMAEFNAIKNQGCAKS
jgi:hypothetical protein